MHAPAIVTPMPIPRDLYALIHERMAVLCVCTSGTQESFTVDPPHTLAILSSYSTRKEPVPRHIDLGSIDSEVHMY